jgi:hypothetical protein
MTEISVGKKANRVEISNYNGNSEGTLRYGTMPTTFPRYLDFFREGNNHSYIRGKIFYKGGCENTLVISPYAYNFLKDVRDAFVLVADSFIEVSPIRNLTKVIEKAKSHYLEKGLTIIFLLQF